MEIGEGEVSIDRWSSPAAREMDGGMKEQGILLVRKAVEEDDAGNHARALPLYVHALDYLAAHLKYERNPRVRDAITAKLAGYIARAEEIRDALLPAAGDDATPPAAAAEEGKAKCGGEDESDRSDLLLYLF